MSEKDLNEIGDELLAERRGGPEAELPQDMHPLARMLIKSIDTLNDWVGKLVCLLVVPIIIAMVYEVVARKLFTATWLTCASPVPVTLGFAGPGLTTAGSYSSIKFIVKVISALSSSNQEKD